MSFAQLAATPTRKLPGNPCSIAALLDSLDDTERAALQAMLDDRRWTSIAIYRSILDEGHDVARQTVNRHRAGLCRCAKERA